MQKKTKTLLHILKIVKMILKNVDNKKMGEYSQLASYQILKSKLLQLY